MTHPGTAVLICLAALALLGCGSDETTTTPGGGGAGAQAGAGGLGAGGSTTSSSAAGGSGGTVTTGGSGGGAVASLLPDCAALLSDTTDYAPGSLEMPGYLESVIDPVFGTKVTRVTGDPDTDIPSTALTWRDPGGPGYAKRSSWNADQSLMQMTNTSVAGTLLLDGSDYHVVAYAGGPPSGGERRWHPTDPSLMVYVSNTGSAGYWNPLEDTQDERFVPTTALQDCRMGPYEGNPSNDGRWVVVACDVNDADPYFFAVDLETGTKYVTIYASELGFSGLDWACMSPSGQYIVASQNSQEQRTLAFTETSYEVIADWQNMGHYDLGYDVDGNEVAANGSGWMVRLVDGLDTRILTTGAGDYHTSTRNLLLPGWSFNSPYDAATILENEIYAMELASEGRIRRLVHHRSTTSSYEADPFGVASPDGNRVFFRSDWGVAGGAVYGFVVDIRELCD